MTKKEEGRQLPIDYISKSMTDVESRYPCMERLALALVSSAWRLRPYFQAHSIKVIPNFPLKQVFNKPKTSGRLTKWAMELSDYDINFELRNALKGPTVTDFVIEMTPYNAMLQGDDQCTLYVDDSSNKKGCGAGELLLTPDGLCFEYALKSE